LLLPGDPFGLGPGPHPACAIEWGQLAADDVDRFLVDHLGDDFLAVVPAAFWRDSEGGRCAWVRADLEPLALVGTPGMHELGASWRDAPRAAAVLFLDHRSEPPVVVGWDGSAVRGLLAIADSLDALS